MIFLLFFSSLNSACSKTFLESQGLIETRSGKSNVGRGRTQYITMNNVAPANLANRIEKELQR